MESSTYKQSKIDGAHDTRVDRDRRELNVS